MGPGDFGSLVGMLNSADPDKWTGKNFAAENYWRINYAGINPRCQLWVEFTEAVVMVTCLIRIRIWGDCQLATYRYLLRLNEEMVMAKFGMDASGNISLSAELPRDLADFAQLEKAVRTVAFYFKHYYEDIRLVAEDREIAQVVASRELLSQAMEHDLASHVKVADWQ